MRMFRAMACVLAASLVSGCQARQIDIQIQLEPLYNLGDLEPSFRIFLWSSTPFAVDSNENAYFVDHSNHRILVFDSKGRFLNQIGSIGQGARDLYNPFGVAVRDSYAIVLNQLGKEIKTFDSSGQLRSTFLFPEKAVRHVPGIWAHSQGIFIDPKNVKREPPLIRLVSWAGEEIASFGEIILCANGSGYTYFNFVHLTAVGKAVFGAHRNWPIVFAYDDQGDLVFRKDIRSLQIPEIEANLRKTEQEGFDTPDRIISEKGIRGIHYCSGLAALNEEIVLYAVAHTPRLLFFDLAGKPVAKALLQHQGNAVYSLYLYQSQNGSIYVIGGEKGSGYNILYKAMVLVN